MKNSIFALFLFCFMGSGLLAQNAPAAEQPVSIPANALEKGERNPGVPPPPPPPPSTKQSRAVVSTTPVPVPDKANTYSRVPDMPKFKGCESLDRDPKKTCSRESMLKYIYEHPNFAAQQAKGVSGTCVYEFIVDTDGVVGNIRILRALRDDAAFLDETRAIFKGMPKWTPGMIDGKAVNVQMSVPVSFKR